MQRTVLIRLSVIPASHAESFSSGNVPNGGPPAFVTRMSIRPNFLTAVTDTKDYVVTYRRELVKTPYFNQSDGRTRSALEMWGWTNTPYLQSVEDPHCAGMIKRGHGVGLSGCGADGMAKEGKTYEEIIKYFYQDVEVEKKSF